MKSRTCISMLFNPANSVEVSVPTVILHISFMDDVTPCQVSSIDAIMPPNRFVIPAVSISTAFAPGIRPFDTISWSAGTVVPISSASISHAGIPTSVSWSISCAASLPLAWICPKARVILSIPSFPTPRAAAASPTARSTGRTSSAANPYASIRLAAICSSGYSKGVLAAKSAMSSRNFCAFSALPSMVAKPICAVWSMELKSIAVLMVALKPFLRASNIAMPKVTENAFLNIEPILEPALSACASAFLSPFSYSFGSTPNFAITCPTVILSHLPLPRTIEPLLFCILYMFVKAMILPWLLVFPVYPC